MLLYLNSATGCFLFREGTTSFSWVISSVSKILINIKLLSIATLSYCFCHKFFCFSFLSWFVQFSYQSCILFLVSTWNYFLKLCLCSYQFDPFESRCVPYCFTNIMIINYSILTLDKNAFFANFYFISKDGNYCYCVWPSVVFSLTSDRSFLFSLLYSLHGFIYR